MANTKPKAAKSTPDYSLDPVIEFIDAHTQLLMETQEGSPNALENAVGVLLSVKTEAKVVEGLKEEECRFTMIELDSKRKPFLTLLNILERAEKYLKDRILKEYAGTDALVDEETGGTVTFKQTWTHELLDDKAVPAEYLVVSSSKVQAAVDNGIRNIPGIRIFQARTVVATPCDPLVE